MALHAPLLRELVHALLGDWGDVFMTGDEREGDGAEAALPTVRLNPAVAAWLPRPDAGELLSLAAVGAVYAQLDDGNAGAGAGATATTTAAALFAGVDAALDPQFRTAVAALVARCAAAGEAPAQFVVTTFHPQLVAVADRVFGVSHVNRVSRIDAIDKGDALAFVRQEEEKEAEAAAARRARGEGVAVA